MGIPLRWAGLIFVLIFSSFSYGQTHITLLNGHEVYFLDHQVLENELSYTYPGKRGEIKTGIIEKERIYSITNSKGETQILYAPDTSLQEHFSVHEMGMFIKGEQASLSYFKPALPKYIGLAGGVAGGLLSGSLGVLSPVVPALFIIGTGIPAVKIKRPVADSLLASEHFRLGYKRVARSYRIQQSLKFALLGFCAGAGFIYRNELEDLFR